MIFFPNFLKFNLIWETLTGVDGHVTNALWAIFPGESLLRLFSILQFSPKITPQGGSIFIVIYSTTLYWSPAVILLLCVTLWCSISKILVSVSVGFGRNKNGVWLADAAGAAADAMFGRNFRSKSVSRFVRRRFRVRFNQPGSLIRSLLVQKRPRFESRLISSSALSHFFSTSTSFRQKRASPGFGLENKSCFVIYAVTFFYSFFQIL